MSFPSLKSFLLALILPVLLAYAVQGQALEKQEVSKEIALSLPKDFRKLTGQEITKHYLSYRQEPVGMYVDPMNEAEVVVNVSKAMFDGSDVAMMKDFYKANIQSLYTKVKFWKEEIDPVGGHKAVVLEFSSEAAEKNKPTIKKYTYAQYVVLPRRVNGQVMGGYVVVFTFTCDKKNRTKWQPIAKKIMETAKVSGELAKSAKF